jgi:hypothetical protein
MLTCGATAWGQVSITTLGSAYTQDFSSLVSSGTSSTVPGGWAFLETGTNANATYTAGTGSNNTGDTYSLGVAGVNPVGDRALGGLRSANLVPIVGASFTNNTGSTINSLVIAYTGEQWRLGYSGHTDKIMFAYSTDATSLSSGTWTLVTALDFSSPITSGTVGARDGNAAANRLAISSTISGLAIANGATFWIRWTDYDPTGADDVLAVDDFSLTATGATTYTLTYTAGTGGTISGTTPQTVPHGGSGTQVTAVPNTGHHFVRWSDGVLTASRTETNVTANVSVTAEFALDTHTLTTAVDPALGGSVTLDPTGGTYDYGTPVTVTAVPNTGSGYHFVEWTGSFTGSANPASVTMDGDKSVTANFALDTYTLTYTAGTGGTISGTTPQTVAYGGSGTEVTAEPDAGYHFASWSDGVLTAARTETNVTADVNVTASFSPLGVHNLDSGLYFATLTAAINDAGTLPGHTLQVAAGTYEEQVVVNKALTITGAGCGSTIIQSPVALAQSYTAPQGTTKPIVFVNGVNATIQDLTIDGAGRGNNNLRFVGLGFWNGGGKTANLCIQNMADTPVSTQNHGAGIHACNNTGGPYSLEVDHVTVTDYQKTGLALEGTGLTVNVHDCTTTGKGYTAEGPGQNGIQVSRGAVGTVTRCKVTDFGYINATYQSSGVLLYSTPGPVTVSDCKGANKFSNVQVPVYVYNASGIVDGIEVAGGADTIAVCAVNANASALLSRAGAEPSERHASFKPSPFGGDDDETAALARSASPTDVLATSYTLSVTNSCLYGSDVAGTVGIGVDSYGGSMDVTATNNVLQDWDYGLRIYTSPATLVAHENAIISSVTAGFDASANPTQNATRNWWGNASGPSGDGSGTGDAVYGASFSPWIHSGTNLASGCGFTPPTYTITASAGANGSISPTGTLTAYEGDDQTYTITPDAGYSIADVLVDSVPVGAVASYTFSNVTAGHTIAASFMYALLAIDAPTTVTTLQMAMPNPSRDGVTLAFSLAERGPVNLCIYSVDGRRVRTLATGTQEPGYYRHVWDGRDDSGNAVPAGVFYARLVAGKVRITRTMSYRN